MIIIFLKKQNRKKFNRQHEMLNSSAGTEKRCAESVPTDKST